LIEPPWPTLAGVVAENRKRLSSLSYDVQGRPLAELIGSARSRLIREALAYTRQYRDVSIGPGLGASEPTQASLATGDSVLSPPIVLSGHQPQLFHPGVWYKNFVLGRLSGQVAGIGIHLVIDGDLCRAAAIRVPTGLRERPRVAHVQFDRPDAEIPYEERPIRDRGTLASFADRVVAALQPFVDEPLVRSLWPLTLARSREEDNLGLCLAQGRHRLEAEFGNETLELPQSAVCRMPEFAWFAAHLLANLPRFQAAHNSALTAYRRAHRLRNLAHPVPNLARFDEWLEAPFWIWTAADPLRRPLFARQRDRQIEISDRGGFTAALDLSSDGDGATAVAQLLAIAERGVRIRTRALTTTLFARLFLSDLFLHGIGGAKYDQATNEMSREFFDFNPPEFATVSATLRLPIDRRPGPQARGLVSARAEAHLSPAAPSNLRQQLRELHYHPERHLTDGFLSAEELSRSEGFARAKLRWVQTPKSPQNARERHYAIAAANAALAALVAERRQWLERQLADDEAGRRAASILHSREYSFCLFPRSHFEWLLRDQPEAKR
jgi:hypothetical protein